MTIKTLLTSLSRRRYSFLRRPEPVRVPLSLSQRFTLERSALVLGLPPERLARLLLTAALSEASVHFRADLNPEDRATFIQRSQADLDRRHRDVRRHLRGGPDNPD